MTDLLILSSSGRKFNPLAGFAQEQNLRVRIVCSITEAVSALLERVGGREQYDALLTCRNDRTFTTNGVLKKLRSLNLRIPVYEVGIPEEVEQRVAIAPSEAPERFVVTADNRKYRDICHDINNLIGASIGYSELALKEIESDHSSWELVTLCKNTLDTAAELIRGFSQELRRHLDDFSSQNQVYQGLEGSAEGSAGREVTAPLPAEDSHVSVIDLDSLVNRVAGFARKMMRSECRLTVRIFNDQLRVAGDEHRLTRGLMNVLLNSLESIPYAGQIEIRVYLSGPGDRNMVCLEIEDDGPGIPPELRERVFQEGFSTRGDGRGRGLSIVKRVVEESNGIMEAVQGMMGGAMIRIYLPVVEGALDTLKGLGIQQPFNMRGE